MTQSSTSYRPEIDGLRAIAVMLVILYHLQIKAFGGGFIGVDVFFVISGFLITTIILGDLRRDSFSYAAFYERRIRRIGPALLCVLLGSSLLFLGWFSAVENKEFSKQNIFALLSISNFYYYTTVDYFNDARQAPSVHTWSLSVEEQFYVVFPVLLYTLNKYGRRWMFPALGSLAIASFLCSIYLVQTNRLAAFYLPFGRWWELLVGSLLAVKGLHSEAGPGRKDALLMLGLTGILIPGFVFKDRMPFPGALATIPVLATALIIYTRRSSGVVCRLFLTNRLSIHIGKISYSLYLVHWPVICLASSFFNTSKAFVSLPIIAVCLLLAQLSYRFVEIPFRTRHKTTMIRFYGNASFAYVVVIVLFVGAASISSMYWRQFPLAEKYFSAAAESSRNTQFGVGSCFLTSSHPLRSEYNESKCLAIDNSRRNILLLGDSHSAHFMKALTDEMPESRFLQASASGCKPLLQGQPEGYCKQLVQYVLHDWLPLHHPEVDTVIVSARWDATDKELIAQTVQFLEGLHVKVVVFGPTPEYLAPLPRILAWKTALNLGNISDIFLRQDRFDVDNELKSADLSGSYISLVDDLCSERSTCRAVINSTPTFFDKDHLTNDAASYLVGRHLNLLNH